jgi:tRNA acetyltransferase TAN1
LAETQEKPRLFSAVRIDIECVMFFKVQPAIDPVDLCHRICMDISANPDKKLTRYVNRISPMTLIGKANEKDLAEVTRDVLRPHFQLAVQDQTLESQPKATADSETLNYTVSDMLGAELNFEFRYHSLTVSSTQFVPR